MTHAVIKDVLAGRYAIGDTVTVKGWIRTRRDSKAGISFLAIHDGSCFDAVQAVAPAELVLAVGTGLAPAAGHPRREHHRSGGADHQCGAIHLGGDADQ